jgi:hypothetical protein
MMVNLTVKAIHTVIDSHGVRQSVKADSSAKADALQAAAALADTKRGNTDKYRIAILAMIAALVAGGNVAKDGSKAGRRDHLDNGGAAFSVSIPVLFAGETVKNSGAALSTWINRNAHRAGTDKSKVVTLRDEEQPDSFWIMLRD